MTTLTVYYIRSLENEISLLRRHWGNRPFPSDIDTAAALTAHVKADLVAETHGNVPLMPPQDLILTSLVSPNGKTETLLIVTLYGANRHPEVLEWHRKVIAHFGLGVNYLQCPFPAVSHGDCVNQLLAQTMDAPKPPDYYMLLDMDCVPLRREALSLAYQQVHDGVTLWGHLWMSNHKLGPNGTKWHQYASQACLMFPRSLYLALGRPDMDHWIARSDTAEELTYQAKAAGYNVSLLYPSYSIVADTDGDNGVRYGMGNTYGPLSRPLWHHTSYTGNPRHVEVFVETCKMVLAGAFEGDKPALPYSYVVPPVKGWPVSG